MNKILVKCSYCDKEFQRERGRYNEARKIGWNQYCSKECQKKSKITGITRICGNPKCNKIIFRQLREFKKSKSGLIFCSLSCAASVNSKIPKRKAKIKKCYYCGKEFVGEGTKYCSKKCKNAGQTINRKVILKQIKGFFREHERIPVKREFLHHDAARDRFGTWNKAITAAGFKPNPVIFAEKHRAKDGHICDSLSEKIIDDWFFKNNIKHKINIPYPKNPKLTCDFVVDKYFIEFFGLEGELPRYTELVKVKKKLAKKHNLNLVALEPKHLFPQNKLNIVLNFLLKNN